MYLNSYREIYTHVYTYEHRYLYVPIHTEVPASTNPNDEVFQEALAYFDDQRMAMHEVASVHVMDRPIRVRKHRSG